MTNSIQAIEVHNRRLTPMEAEIEVVVTLNCVNPNTEIRGRLIGPRCALASTVEVAYPMRRTSSDEKSRVTFAVHVPEPSLWEPECPFYYDGGIELWEDGERIAVQEFRHELRRK
jgi:hypothetical protein